VPAPGAYLCCTTSWRHGLPRRRRRSTGAARASPLLRVRRRMLRHLEPVVREAISAAAVVLPAPRRVALERCRRARRPSRTPPPHVSLRPHIDACSRTGQKLPRPRNLRLLGILGLGPRRGAAAGARAAGDPVPLPSRRRRCGGTGRGRLAAGRPAASATARGMCRDARILGSPDSSVARICRLVASASSLCCHNVQRVFHRRLRYKIRRP
jgi:hypothetical protein